MVSHTNEYNVATTEIARWEGNTWVVEVTGVKTGARSQQRRWLEGQNTMRFVRPARHHPHALWAS